MEGSENTAASHEQTVGIRYVDWFRWGKEAGYRASSAGFNLWKPFNIL